MSDVTIYDHSIDLFEPKEGVVTDVIVLARVVRHSEGGSLEDSLLLSSTKTTTAMLQLGIISQANSICTDYEQMPDGDDDE